MLTGVPVAGVAYLDRPQQAGYFIFPDLSVRHEGRYRLTFHLYEEIKEAKDVDKDSNLPLPNQLGRPNTSKPGSPQAFLHFRLEVKTVPFTVYSAKKFPGLATSTSLSRVIAEQGCRVRIRRDVRMRRRGDKREEDFKYDEERAAVYRADRYSTPDRYVATSVERPRSNSQGSAIESPYGYGSEIQRRPSAPDYGFQCPPQPYQRPMPPAPMPHAQAPSYQSHLSFGSTPSSHYPAPHMPPTPPPAAPAASIYSPHSNYASVRQMSNASEYEASPAGYSMAPQVPDRTGYPKPTMSPYRVDPQRSQSFMDPRVPDSGPYQPMLQNMVPPAPTPSMAAPPNVPTHALPSVKAPSSEYANVQPSIECASPSPGYDSVSGKRIVYQSGSVGGKRTHEDSFGVDDRSLQNGMRPDSEIYSHAGYRDFSAESRAALMAEMGIEMAYKRANGRMAMKAPPNA